MAKEREQKDDDRRQIIPVIDDEGIFLWLERLFDLTPRTEAPPKNGGESKPKSDPDSFPERIELKPIFGRGGKDTGKPISSKEWKPTQSPTPSREQLVTLANEMLGRAQGDCNGLQHPQRYGLFAFSRLKGSDYYERHLISLIPTGKEYNDKDTPATDDNGTHRDLFLQATASHNRWLVEQQQEVMSGMFKLLSEDNRNKSEQIAQLMAERRSMIITMEEALSKKQEREERAEWAKIKNGAIMEGLGMVRSLVPAVQIYLSRGKLGIAEGLKSFVEGLTDDVKHALFGKWNEQGQCETAGILDVEQVQLIVGIVDGKIEPKRVSELVSGLRQDQLMAASQVLSPVQIQALGALAKAANDVNTQNGAAS